MEYLTCIPKSLAAEQMVAAAKTATTINPLNHAPLERLARVMPGFVATPERIAVVTTKYWGLQGVKLTVGFLDNPETALRTRLLLHMNAWAKTANVTFVETSTDPQVRVARTGGTNGGYWSYLGTDILHIAKDQQTMNLENFTMQMPESEFHRVVRHETGHTLGFPHEHLRKGLVAKLDVAKTITYFERTQGWSEADVRAQVLTPLDESTLRGTAVDQMSIMCYQLPGAITLDGKPIIGGTDIDPTDYSFAALIYPKAKPAPPKPAPPKQALKKSAAKKAVAKKPAAKKVAAKKPIAKKAVAKKAAKKNAKKSAR